MSGKKAADRKASRMKCKHGIECMNTGRSNWLFFTVMLSILGGNIFLSAADPGAGILKQLSVNFLCVSVPGMIFSRGLRWDDWSEHGRDKRAGPAEWLLEALFMVLNVPVLMAVNMLSMFITENKVEKYSGSITSVPLVPVIILAGILLPFAEEYVFRGLIMGGYNTSGREGLAVLFSAVMFGLYHLNLNQMAYTSVFGLVLGFAAAASGNIWTAVFMHMAFNITELVIMYMNAGGGSSYVPCTGSAAIMSASAIICTCISVIPIRKAAALAGRKDKLKRAADPRYESCLGFNEGLCPLFFTVTVCIFLIILSV